VGSYTFSTMRGLMASISSTYKTGEASFKADVCKDGAHCNLGRWIGLISGGWNEPGSEGVAPRSWVRGCRNPYGHSHKRGQSKVGTGFPGKVQWRKIGDVLSVKEMLSRAPRQEGTRLGWPHVRIEARTV
jgi:hypothetical protein